ncbi:DJ-1/PfpI family protein [Desulfatibacillum aliphaticivorans]|uniref:DJ-1/PfpI family protein n=1 Tax=Desulfatibacillum aliphaticivorans TaxID=218208 RepID=UPI00041CD2AC|nr:DJ-1/PfpI family protein [Desulfatibacillum aliphaticivorans]
MKKVLLFLAQGFEEYEAAVFTDVLGWSRVVGDVPVEVVTAGLRPEIQCTWSLIVKPQAQLKDLDLAEFDALAIPGGFQRAGFYEDAYHEDFLEAVRHFDKTGKPIAAICVGAMPVGKSGVLNGRKATTYHLVNGRRRKQLAEFGAVVLDQHVVVDRNIITSTGPATGLEVAFTLLEMLTTRENVEKVQEAMAIIDPNPL